MIPSDHFVRFYNEVFKFLEAQDPSLETLKDYYREISEAPNPRRDEFFRHGIHGMCEYWDMIRVEEDCDLEIHEFPDHAEFRMRRCPSLSKITDNDAGPYARYCHHCPGWIIPAIERADCVCEFNIGNPLKPSCGWKIYPGDSGKASRALEEE